MVYAVVITLYLPYTQPTWLPIFAACQLFRTVKKSRFHLRPANQREGYCFVLPHGHIFHLAAPERIVKFRNRLGQLFQFRDKSLEFPPADTALTDVDSHLFALRLGSLITADRSIVDGVVIILVLCHPSVLGDQFPDRFRLRVQAFIAQKLNDTERNIYYYLDQAKKIGKQYKRDNE